MSQEAEQQNDYVMLTVKKIKSQGGAVMLPELQPEKREGWQKVADLCLPHFCPEEVAKICN
jgi:hypothetical protein